MKNKDHNLSLLSTETLVKTGSVDHADWNHKPLLGAISRARFHLIKQLFGERRGGRLLEIGYGSGVFLPELAKYSDEIYGIDVHNEQEKVAESLAKFDVHAELVSSGAETMPWEDGFFDFVVAVSAIEFVTNLHAVCDEVNRVLKPGGSFLVVTPGKSPILDVGLKILTGKSAKDDFANRREQILPTLYKHFNVRKNITFPKYKLSPVKFYTALELQTKVSKPFKD